MRSTLLAFADLGEQDWMQSAVLDMKGKGHADSMDSALWMRKLMLNYEPFLLSSLLVMKQNIILVLLVRKLSNLDNFWKQLTSTEYLDFNQVLLVSACNQYWVVSLVPSRGLSSPVRLISPILFGSSSPVPSSYHWQFRSESCLVSTVSPILLHLAHLFYFSQFGRLRNSWRHCWTELLARPAGPPLPPRIHEGRHKGQGGRRDKRVRRPRHSEPQQVADRAGLREGPQVSIRYLESTVWTSPWWQDMEHRGVSIQAPQMMDRFATVFHCQDAVWEKDTAQRAVSPFLRICWVMISWRAPSRQIEFTNEDDKNLTRYLADNPYRGVQDGRLGHGIYRCLMDLVCPFPHPQMATISDS